MELCFTILSSTKCKNLFISNLLCISNDFHFYIFRKQNRIKGFALRQMEKHYPKGLKSLKKFYNWAKDGDSEYELLRTITKSFWYIHLHWACNEYDFNNSGTATQTSWSHSFGNALYHYKHVTSTRAKYKLCYFLVKIYQRSLK